MKQNRQALSVGVLVLSLLAALAMPCSAMSKPVYTTVSSMAEFLELYHSQDAQDAPGTMREYVSRNPLVCTGNVTLSSTAGLVDLAALQGIRIPDGAVLTLDNPNLIIEGPPPVITVEQGGMLRILRWHPYLSDGTMPTDEMIRVEEGGTLWSADGVTLPDGMVVKDEPPNTILPPRPEPDPEPELRPIKEMAEGPLYRVSQAGRTAVESSLPATVMVRLTWEVAGNLPPACPNLAVRWDLSGIDCDTPGTYTVYGDFVPEALTASGISNPNGLRPELSLTILKSAPIQDLSWTVIGPSGGSTYALRLAFTPLPEDATHLYLSRSTDGVNWRRDGWSDSPEQSYGQDFLPSVNTYQGTSFLACRIPREVKVLYLRLEVEGSICAGNSNVIRLQPASLGESMGSGGPNADAEDGHFDGNRGGGGQGQADRVEQQQPPAESPKLSAGQDAAAPKDVVPDEREEELDPHSPLSFVNDETESDSAGQASSWMLWGGRATADSGRSDAAEAVSPKEAAPQTEPGGEASKAGASESPTEPVHTGQPMTNDVLEIPAEKPLGSADRNGVVLAASFALFGGVAVAGQRGKRTKL